MRTISTMALALLASAALDPAASQGDQGGQVLTARDMIRVAAIGDPDSLTWADYSRQDVDYSPDGTRAAVIVRWGDPDAASYNGRLLLYRLGDLEAAPETLVEFRSETNYQPIGDLRWLGNNALVFGATDGRRNTQVYRLDLAPRRLRALTAETAPVRSYALSPAGNRLALFAETPVGTPLLARENCVARGCQVTETLLSEASSGIGWRRVRGGTGAVYDLDTGARRALRTPDDDPDSRAECAPSFLGGLSPGGRYAIQLCRVDRWPEWWNEHERDTRLRRSLASGNAILARQLFLLDLETGRSSPLNDSPVLTIGLSAPLWIDEHRLLLVGAVSPPARAGAVPIEQWGVVEVDVATGRQRQVSDVPAGMASIRSANWNETRQTLCVVGESPGAGTQGFSLRRRNGEWASRAACPPRPAPQRAVEIYVRESLGERPVLMARDTRSGATRILLDANSWLDDYRTSAVERVDWVAADGRNWHGHLYFPPGFQPGTRYPLVIHAHDNGVGERLQDWRYRSFPAQPMAARGMIVLQAALRDPRRDLAATRGELAAVRSGLEGAIDYLDGRALIDRRRVGLFGWSRSGWYTNSMLTHSAYPIAAAMTLDSNDFGWWTYMAWGGHRAFEQNLEAAPFGTDIEHWLEQAPSFNLDRVRTPLLMWNVSTVDGRWDMYAGLRRLRQPVEYWVFPDAVHDLMRVPQRLTATELMVDWFDFWLNGHEGSTASRSRQYERWRELRILRNRSLAVPRPPLLDWRATPMPSSAD